MGPRVTGVPAIMESCILASGIKQKIVSRNSFGTVGRETIIFKLPHTNCNIVDEYKF